MNNTALLVIVMNSVSQSKAELSHETQPHKMNQRTCFMILRYSRVKHIFGH